MLLVTKRLTIYAITAFLTAGALLCLAPGACRLIPSHAATRSSLAVDHASSPVSYPPVTPWTSWSAHSITELRHLKTDTGSPHLPTPNPWFPIDLYQGTITRQQFEQKLHALYDPFSSFTPSSTSTIRASWFTPRPRTGKPRNSCSSSHRRISPARQCAGSARRRKSAPMSHPLDKPLNGLRVAIDPGHIGGPLGSDGRAQHPISRQRARAGRRSQPHHGPHPQAGTDRDGRQRLRRARLTEPVTPYRPQRHDRAGAGTSRRPFLPTPQPARTPPPDKLNLLFGQRLMELSEFLF